MKPPIKNSKKSYISRSKLVAETSSKPARAAKGSCLASTLERKPYKITPDWYATWEKR